MLHKPIILITLTRKLAEKHKKDIKKQIQLHMV